MNSRGQEFSGFRLLIDAVLVLLILIIIISVLGWVDSMRFQISEKQLYDGFTKSVNSPNGNIIMEKDLVIREGQSFTSATFGKLGNLERECIEFDAPNSQSISISSNRRQIEITSNLQLDMYYMCIKNFRGNECEEQCDMCCVISFGKDLSQE